MLRALAEDQEIVWNQAFAGIETQGRFTCTPAEIARDLDGMIMETEMTRSSVSGSKSPVAVLLYSLGPDFRSTRFSICARNRRASRRLRLADYRRMTQRDSRTTSTSLPS
jgi:hypothetical protein